MNRWRKQKYRLITIVGILVVGFIIFDNARIRVVEQEIFIQHLPSEFEAFRILQISDLHEKEFGKNQERLLKKIHSLDFDVIVFTGDMLTNRKSTNYQPFYTILEKLEHKGVILYVPGNTDPPNYQTTPTFDKSEFVKGIEARGGTLLESFVEIEKNNQSLYFINFELAIIENVEQIGKVHGTYQTDISQNEAYKIHQKNLWKQMMSKEIVEGPYVKIAINHFPVPDIRIDYIQEDTHTAWRDFDLLIAGHYHGGQIRLPFIGAFFIPEPWYESQRFFPPKNRVKGLWAYKKTKQYVSTGLGTSDAVPFFNFRLFNPPEINLLTLKRE